MGSAFIFMTKASFLKRVNTFEYKSLQIQIIGLFTTFFVDDLDSSSSLDGDAVFFENNFSFSSSEESLPVFSFKVVLLLNALLLSV